MSERRGGETQRARVFLVLLYEPISLLAKERETEKESFQSISRKEDSGTEREDSSEFPSMMSEKETRTGIDFDFLVLQYLKEKNYNKTLHELERESGCFIDIEYFGELVVSGNWDEAERYLSSFIKLEDDQCSIFYCLREQKYLEALDRHDWAAANAILAYELEVFAEANEQLFKDLTELLIMKDFRKHKRFAGYTTTTNERTRLMSVLKKRLEENALLRNNLAFPNLADSTLQNLINQSSLCEQPSSRNQQIGSRSQLEGFVPVASNTPFLVIPVGNLPTSNCPAFSGGTMDVPINAVAPPWSLGDRSFVKNTRVMLPVNSINRSGTPVHDITDELPTTVIRTLNQGAEPTSMDFHPVLPTLLLVGTKMGSIGLWEVGSREELFSVGFSIWDYRSISRALKLALRKDPRREVNRIKWSPTGSIFGAVYAHHILHLYSYRDENVIRQHLEIDAHVGSVNDLAFASCSKQSVITCGDDKTVKVWDVATGAKLFSLEGQEAPVFSVCPFVKDNAHVVFFTSTDGKKKIWIHENSGASVDLDVPGDRYTTISLSTDGGRRFSCSTNRNGETYLVEWIGKGVVTTSYKGFHKRSYGVVHFDTAKNRFLAAGYHSVIKFWEIGHVDPLAEFDAEGDLPETPCVRFNNQGTLLAASTSNGRIKILANFSGICFLLQTSRKPVSAN